jgi:hypothetical protein
MPPVLHLLLPGFPYLRGEFLFPRQRKPILRPILIPDGAARDRSIDRIYDVQQNLASYYEVSYKRLPSFMISVA